MIKCLNPMKEAELESVDQICTPLINILHYSLKLEKKPKGCDLYHFSFKWPKNNDVIRPRCYILVPRIETGGTLQVSFYNANTYNVIVYC